MLDILPGNTIANREWRGEQYVLGAIVVVVLVVVVVEGDTCYLMFVFVWGDEANIHRKGRRFSQLANRHHQPNSSNIFETIISTL